jgi:outer membrane biosynthesis protein TonB
MKDSINKRKDRRRSMLLTLLLQSIVVGVCVFPFLSGSIPATEKYDTVVEFDFTQSAAAASADVKVRNEVKRPITERKAAPKNPAPPASPAKPAAPVLTSPSPLPPVRDVPKSVPTPEPVLTPNPAPAPVIVDKPAKDPGPPASTADNDGDSNASGVATGSPETGKGSTVSDVGEGKAPIGSALEGDGILTRAVVYRPALDEVVKQNGTVVLNICINQQGRVIGVKWNEERSTIKDTDIVREAIDKATKYRFETSYDAPSRECGALSISIKGL